ncbi:MAG: hypothetical protein M1820_010666, partial [Bogoriella megaspora]
RLAEDPNVSVLVVEAGPDNENLENVHMVGGWSKILDSETDWNIETESMSGIGGRKVKTSRGRFLGGSSGINGTLCIRGTKQDYDDWNIEGWSGDEMFQYMAKASTTFLLSLWRKLMCFQAETFHGKDWFHADKGSHGYGGPLHVEPHDLAPISDRVMESYQHLGMPFRDDMFTTGSVAHGCGHAPRTVHKGIRSTGADFITKTYRRENITIRTNHVVDKVLFHETSDGSLRASGLDVVAKDGTRSTVRARKEVVVSGGTYCSPAILLRSGIGSKSDLEKVGIECKVDLPGVGKNLADHIVVFLFYEVTEPGLTKDHLVYHGNSLTSSYTLWKEKKEGFLSSFPFGAFAYARLDDRLANEPSWQEAPREEGRDPMGLTKDQPNIEFFHTECYGGPKQYTEYPANSHAFAMIPELFSPRSRGSVSLKSPNPLELPIVDHNYLADPLDLLVLSEACRFGNEVIVNGKGTKDVIKGSWPAHLTHHKHTTREDWIDYVKANATTCYHPGGTCKMGREDDALAVLDGQLRVRGVQGLRVADCSVMPTLNMGHTQMPAYAIGGKAADLIKAAAS